MVSAGSVRDGEGIARRERSRSSVVEHFLGKEEAMGSIPIASSGPPSSNGQDATLSRWRPGFDSPWGRKTRAGQDGIDLAVRFPVGAQDTGQDNAGVAQLVERHVANVKVASSNLVARFVESDIAPSGVMGL